MTPERFCFRVCGFRTVPVKALYLTYSVTVGWHSSSYASSLHNSFVAIWKVAPCGFNSRITGGCYNRLISTTIGGKFMRSLG